MKPGITTTYASVPVTRARDPVIIKDHLASTVSPLSSQASSVGNID